MRKYLILLVILGATLVAASCSEDRAVTPQQATMAENDHGTTVDSELIATEIVLRSGWTFDEEVEIPQKASDGGEQPEATCQIIHFEREPLVGDVVHYSYQLRVGSGPYDVIGLHRVVKERRPYRPIKTRKNIFLQHGDLIGFVKFIFGSITPYLPAEQSFATYLANNDIDVWGIDQPWVLVPALDDYSFAANWGIQNQVDNLKTGIAVARFVRLLTGSRFDKMNLLGYSSGGFTGYAYLNEESQHPNWRRHVKGFVCVDALYKYDTSVPLFEEARQWGCIYATDYESSWADGGYDAGFGVFGLVGELAENAPDDPSPIFEGLTNLEAALAAGAFPDPTAFSPWYHFVAGIFEGEPPFPVDLRYTTIGAWLDFLQMASPFEPSRFVADYYKIGCDEEDVPYDDHLADVTVPVLYLGAAGGFGETGFYTLDLLGSEDKEIQNISLNPPGDFDFAHIDIFSATNAMVDVWPLVLQWVEGHSCREAPEEEVGQLATNP